MRCNRNLLLIGILLVMSLFQSAYAACPDKTFFEPSCKDGSVFYLEYLFGSYDLDSAKFATGSPTIFAALFSYIGSAFLKLALLFIIYIIIVGVVRLAFSGQFLGERGSIWTPIRLILGIGALMPTLSGYLVIHQIIMYVVYSGVGAADTVWIRVNEELATKGVYSSGASAVDTALLNSVKANAEQVFKGMLCRYMFNYHKSFRKQGASFDEHIISHSVSGTDPRLVGNSYILDGSVNLDSYTWGENVRQNVREMVAASMGASFRWTTYGVENLGAAGSEGIGATVNFGEYNAVDNSVGQQCGFIQAGKKFPYYVDFINATRDSVREILIWRENNLTKSINNYKFSTKEKEVMQDAGKHFAKCLASPDDAKNCDGGEINIESGSAADIGWIGTGFYYLGLAGNGISSSSIPTPALPFKQFQTPSDGSPPPTDPSRTKINLMAAYLADTLADTSGGGADNPLKPLYTKALSNMSVFNLDSANDYFFFMADLFGPAKYVTEGLAKEFEKTGDPFSSARDAGRALQQSGVIIIMLGISVTFILTLVVNNCNAEVSPGASTKAVYQNIMMSLVTLGGVLYSEGVMFGVFLPMIPLLLWLMAVVGWYMAVFEAMIAAPLIGLAMAWPEQQHEMFGRAEAAIMMMLNLLIRPTLLMFGFILGMLICRVAFSLAGLLIAIGSSDAHPVFKADRLFGWVAVGGAFGAALMVIASKCFSITTELADKAISWIGGQVSSYGGGTEATQAAKSGTKKAGDKAPSGDDMRGLTRSMNERSKAGASKGDGGTST